MAKFRRVSRLAVMASLLAVVATFLSIWWPIFARYYVPTPHFGDELIQASRDAPSQAVLAELTTMGLAYAPPMSPAALDRAAEQIRRGVLDLPGYPPTPIQLPFSARDLEAGLPTWQLQFASLAAPDILLEAYRQTGKDAYFDLARDMIAAWAKYERSAWLPKGFLWNDHAIAGRVSVLTKFWDMYRHRPDFDPAVAQAVLTLVARSGELLAKPGQFTFATNHGVMQNLALLNIAAAFPALPDAARFRQTALARLTDQMGFYIDREGVVLEHSAGYQSFGVYLTGVALRLLTLNGIAIPPDWADKYRRAQAVLAMLARPDGTLPLYGDTDSGRGELPKVASVTGGYASPLALPTHSRPEAASALYPVAGYSVWWDGLKDWPDEANLRQTVMAWSYFRGHGHKSADEMSLMLWAGGQTWITNSGYWPYGVWGRDHAMGWEGSNAPHLAGESRLSQRQTRLVGYADRGSLKVLDLQREGPGGYQVRRQLLHLGPDIWVVLDSTADKAEGESTTTWTTYPGVRVDPGPFPGAYRLEAPGGGAMDVVFESAAHREIKRYAGSRSPFAGWVVVNGAPTAAPAFVVTQPARSSWALAIWTLNKASGASSFTGRPRMIAWQDATHWTVELPLQGGSITLSRDGNRVTQAGQGPGFEAAAAMLTPPPDTRAQTAALRSAFEAAAQKYERVGDFFNYRLKISYLLLGIFLVQELFFLAYGKWKGRHRTALRLANAVAWVGGAVWLYLFYFTL